MKKALASSDVAEALVAVAEAELTAEATDDGLAQAAGADGTAEQKNTVPHAFLQMVICESSGDNRGIYRCSFEFVFGCGGDNRAYEVGVGGIALHALFCSSTKGNKTLHKVHTRL